MTDKDLSPSEFISHASHELKTPITTIKGYTEILLRLLKDEPKPHEYLSRMNEQIDSLTELINEILDVSRIQSGKLMLTHEPVDLVVLTQEVVKDTARRTGRSIKFSGKGIQVIPVDRQRIAQIIAIILGNALMYATDGQKVSVELTKVNKNMRVSARVLNTVISQDELNRLFKPFAQKNSKNYRGWGLDLFIAREIAREHAGTIEVKNNKTDGFSFSLVLPLKSTDSRK